MSDPKLDPLFLKVMLYRESLQSATSFRELISDGFPSVWHRKTFLTHKNLSGDEKKWPDILIIIIITEGGIWVDFPLKDIGGGFFEWESVVFDGFRRHPTRFLNINEFYQSFL